jgi:AcrR family transcriptional regulator
MATTKHNRHARRHAERAERHSRRTVARADKRERLLESAITVVRRDGPGVSMDAIAREAGVTKPIVYRVFGDREGLIQAIADRFADELATTLGSEMDQPDRSYREAVSATIDAYLAFIERDPAIVRFLVDRDIGGAQETSRTTRQLIRNVSGLVARSIGEQLQELGLDSGAAEPWAYAIVGAVHIAGDWWLDQQTMPRERLVEYLTKLVWDGMSNFSEGAS